MNINDFLRELERALDNIHAHPNLAFELLELMGRSGSESQFLRLLLKRLAFLQLFGENAQEHSGEFERISERIYSMHISIKNKNIRILYSFDNSGTVLLLAFHERAGKKATDYTNMIPEATSRLRELEG